MNSPADKELIRQRFAAGFRRYDRLARVQQRICDQLAQRIATLCVSFGPSSELPGQTLPWTASAGGFAGRKRLSQFRCLEIGVGTGFLTRRLVPLFPNARWYLNDLSPAAESFVAKYVAGNTIEYCWGDAETIVLPTRLDLLASASTVQWFDDLPAFVARAASALRAGGVLAVSTFGRDNFREIRATTGEGLFYYTRSELETMLASCGFRLLHSDEYAETLHFDTPADVLRHIRATGVNSLRRVHWGRQQLADFDAAYRREFSTTDGRVVLTYHPILLLGQRR